MLTNIFVIIVAVIIIAGFILVVLQDEFDISIPPLREKPYRNLLQLKALPEIDDFGCLREGRFAIALGELILIVGVLEGWRRERKSLADFVRDKTHRNALLDDIAKLRSSVFYNSEALRYQEGQLLAWEAPVETAISFDFVNLKGRCFITYQEGAVTKLELELRETGLFSVMWEEASQMNKRQEAIATKLRIDSLQTAAVVLVEPPRISGSFYIINHTRNDVFDRIPA